MHRIFLTILFVVPVACALSAGAASKPATQPATKPATKPTSRPVVAAWHPREYPTGEVNLLAMGDWGSNNKNQKTTAMAMATYVQRTQRQFHGMLLEGDNFYVGLKGIDDYQWQSLFEDMYDSQIINFPWYAAYGNHDYEGDKAKIEREYAAKNPNSRWKFPARYYRVDFPSKDPIVSVLMLDSNKPKFNKEEWEAQIKFIEKELSDRKGAKWFLACCHHPIFSNGSHGDNGVLMTEWGQLFQKHKLDFFIVGHDHDLQHLQVENWWPSFLLVGGGGQAARDMRRDIRGPFSRHMKGFAHLQFTPTRCVVRYIDGDTAKPVHIFIRDVSGKVDIAFTTGRDKATTKPLKAILGFEEIDMPTTKPTTEKSK